MVETECDDTKRMKTLDQYRFLAKGFAQNSREENDLCDVVIHVHGVSYHGSRFVLGSASPVLKKMFLSKMKESDNKMVSLEGVSAEGFKVIWDFIHDEEYGTDDEEITLAVLEDSHYLQIDILCEEYANKLKSKLNPENVFALLYTAEKLGLITLHEGALNYISSRFQEIIPTPDFLSMSVETMQMFLGRDDLEVSSEIDIYEAVRKWLNHDPSRNAHMPKLMSQVRLPLLPLSYLHEKVIRDPVISGDPHCLLLVMEAKDFHHPDLHDTVPEEKTSVRGSGFYRFYHTHTYWCLGKKGNENQVLSLDKRDWSVHVFTSYPWPNDPLFARAFSALDRKLFVTGLGVMKVYDLVRKSWEYGPPPPENVQWPTSAVGLDSIFVCGGRLSKDNSKMTKSVTQFELLSWRWIHAPDMKYERLSASSLFLDSNLHVIGGAPNGRKHERLDRRMKSWSELCEWPGSQNAPGVAVHNGEIHVSGGGVSGKPSLSDVYVYEARKNDWRLLAPMREKRRNHGLISFDGCLFAVCGDKTPSIEMYDGTDWKVVAQLDLETCERACVMRWTVG